MSDMARRYAVAWVGKHFLHFEAYEKAGFWTPREITGLRHIDRPSGADREVLAKAVADAAGVPAQHVLLLEE